MVQTYRGVGASTKDILHLRNTGEEDLAGDEPSDALGAGRGCQTL